MSLKHIIFISEVIIGSHVYVKEYFYCLNKNDFKKLETYETSYIGFSNVLANELRDIDKGDRCMAGR